MARIHIPNRFESVLAHERLDIPPLIVPVEADLKRFDELRRTVELQNSGVVAFLLGLSGIGKTTAVYSAATHLSETFTHVLLVPHDVPLRDVDAWLRSNLPEQSGRMVPVLLDGREVTDDEVGVRQLFSALNQTLRRRNDVVVLWPTTDPKWHSELRSYAQGVGGESLAPPESDIRIAGPAADQWMAVLERLLLQLELTLDDLALDENMLQELTASKETVGDFLRAVGRAIVERVDQVQLAKELPSLVFVVTSHSEVVGEADRLRRAESYLLGARELMSYSRRSRAGKWWVARRDTPAYNLAYIISLFRARLATMTPSSVAYACAEFGDQPLRDLVAAAGITRNSGNADRTFDNTDLSRLLQGRTTSELTSTRKGRTGDTTKAAYDAVQAVSATRHKAINQAITQLIDRNVPGFNGDLAEFELDLGLQDIFADVVAPFDGESIYLEFHHLSGANCKAASIASYVMEKLQYYAIHYNLIPR